MVWQTTDPSRQPLAIVGDSFMKSIVAVFGEFYALTDLTLADLLFRLLKRRSCWYGIANRVKRYRFAHLWQQRRGQWNFIKSKPIHHRLYLAPSISGSFDARVLDVLRTVLRTIYRQLNKSITSFFAHVYNDTDNGIVYTVRLLRLDRRSIILFVDLSLLLLAMLYLRCL